MARPTKGVTEANGRCYINWYENGKRKHKALNLPYTPANVIKAAKIRAKIIENFSLGIVDRGPCPTFGEVAQKWLDQKEGIHRRKEKGRLNKYWIQFFPIPINQLHYNDLLDIPVQGLAPKTIKNIYGVGSGVFDLAIKSEWISNNPARTLASETKLVKKKVDPFTYEERDAMLSELSGNNLLYYAIRFYCGLRPSEVIALEWRDYDRKTNQFHIRRSTVEGIKKDRTKNGEERYVYVHSFVRKLLKTHPTSIGQKTILVTKEGNAYQKPERLAKSLVPVMAKLGIRKRSTYNARHTCACMMLGADMAPAYCAKALGHRLETFFNIYADHIDKSQGQTQQEKWEAGL